MSEGTQTCPICNDATVHQVRCSNSTCTFVVTTCMRCDRDQAVKAFVVDHEKDCIQLGAVVHPAVFAAPRRAA